MSNQSQFLDEQSSILLEDDLDFENLELPQLTRRNGRINDNKQVQGYIILDQCPQKIYISEQCPICLDQDEDLFPLKCGHTFCMSDIEKLIQQAEEQVIQFPLCRAYQYCPSLKELNQNQHEFQFNDHIQLESN